MAVEKIVAKSKRSGSAAAKWRAIIQEHQASGLPVAQFCREHGLSQIDHWLPDLWKQHQPASDPQV